MKKLIGVLCLLCLVMAPATLAQMLIGARTAGMGGAGAAASRGIPAAYYNPAAFLKTGFGKFSISYGLAYQDYDKVVAAATGLSNPGKFMTDNYGNTFNLNSGVSGITGFQIAKLGISVLPQGNVVLNKPTKDSLDGTFSGNATANGYLTFGYNFGFPGLPASLTVGANAKYIAAYYGNLTSSVTGGTQYWGTGSGAGMDLGLLTSFEVPMVSRLDVGLMARDLIGSVSYKNKSQTLVNTGTTFTYGPETDLADTSVTLNTSYVLGAAATVPGVGLLLALDLETVSGLNPQTNTHIGLEYPILGILALRAGMASGNNLAKTTLGLGIDLPLFALEAAYVGDGKQSTDNSYVFDIELGM